jgi:RNase P subunit RPR2
MKVRKRLESLFNTAYGVVKAGKPFSDYELICEIQVKNGLDLDENYRNINGCKTCLVTAAILNGGRNCRTQF